MKEKRVPEFLNKKYPLLIFFATLLMGVGYASTNVTLSINGIAYVLEEDSVHIISASVLGTPTSGSGSVVSYEGTLLNTTTTLNNASGSVTYEVVIKNNTNSQVTFYGLCKDNSFYNNQYVTYTYTGLSDNDTIAAGSSVTAYVTFTDDGGSSFPSTLNSYLTFNFNQACTNTQVTQNEDGSVTTVTQNSLGEVTGYTIETPDDSNMILNGSTIDTGLIAFDGASSFTIHIVFYATFSSESSYDRVVSVIQDNGSSSSHSYSGFNLFYYYRSSGGGGGSSSSSAKYLRTQTFSGKTALTGQNMSSGNNLYKVDTTITNYYTTRTKYSFDIIYTYGLCTTSSCTTNDIEVISSINDGTETSDSFVSHITSALSNATVTIGGNGIDDTENVETLEIVEFSVVKQ